MSKAPKCNDSSKNVHAKRLLRYTVYNNIEKNNADINNKFSITNLMV